MNNNLTQLNQQYDNEGYFVSRAYFSKTEITSLRELILKFHQRWIEDNRTFYQEEAFNSSLITGSQYLSTEDRISLFNFLSSEKMMAMINTVIPTKPVFMNTQLFFDPVNPEQKDFWHRDCQYDFDLDDQKKIIHGSPIIHFRIPLFDERGIELVPGSHKRWDNKEEFDVRQEQNGKLSSDAISTGQTIPLSVGDLLVFSADMIHRGLYGLDRLALDVLIFDTAAHYADYVDDDCLPNLSMLNNINNPSLYINALQLKQAV